MANGTKTYKIIINGIEESIKGVDNLNKQLDDLEKRISAVENRTINVRTSAGGGSAASSLSEEEKIQKQIYETQQKIAVARSENAKALAQEKEQLKQINKEVQTEAKATVSLNKIGGGETYSNTMLGLKERLKDIKQVMQTTDLDSDMFKQLTKEAGDLTQRLKDIEAGYGTFSRNVGNYANGVSEGIKSARQELRELKTEMQNLTVKRDRGIITEEEDERLKSLIPTVKELESSIKDAGKPMDAMMDTMQSIVAIAQASKGLAALFGFDKGKIEESIQKLVALQNVMQSLQTMQKQMQTGEGLGKYFSKANTAVDKFVAGVTKAKVGVNGLEKTTKTGTIAVKGFSAALKATGIGLAIFVGSEIINGISNMIDRFKEAKKAAKEFNDELSKINDNALSEGINASSEIDEYISKIKTFSGVTSQEKKIIEELNNKYGETLGYYYKMDEWLDILKNKREDYVKLIELENRVDELRTLKNTAELNKKKAEQAKEQAELNYQTNKGIEAASEYAAALKKEEQATYQATIAAFQYKAQLLILNKLRKLQAQESSGATESAKTTTTIKDNTNKKLEAVKKAQENINELTLKLMSDGLYKELKKLDENNRKEIEKIKKNGEKVEEQLKLQYKVYEKEQKKLFDKYIKDIEKSNTSLALQNEIDQVKLLKEQWDEIHLVMNRPTSIKDATLFGSSSDTKTVKELIEQYKPWVQLYDIRNDELSKNNWRGYFEALKKDYLPKAAKEIQDEFNRLLKEERPDSFDGLIEGDLLVSGKNQKKAYNYLMKAFEDETAELKYFLTKYQGEVKIAGNEISQTLEDSYLERVSLTTERFKSILDVVNNYINESLALEKEGIDNEEKLEKEANEERLKNAREGYEKLLSESQKYSSYTSVSVAELLRGREEIDLTDEEKSLQTFVKLIDEYEKEATQITIKYNNQRKAADFNAATQRHNNNYRYYEQEIVNLEDYIQKASNIVDKQPEINKLGFIDIKKTKAQYKEVFDLYKHFTEDIEATTYELIQDVNAGAINGEQFEAAINNLEFYKKKIEENLQDIHERMKQHSRDFLSSINDWLQQIGQATTSILSSLSEITSNHYQEQIDKQQEYMDKLQDLYDKQQDITRKHADALNDIEDELASARGDRRQQLIDALNEEMAAQRASLAQEKRIEKEQEKAEQKRKELEYQKAVSEKKMQEWQAAINAVMAVSMAAVNHWPVPAIPMMALAAAVGAAQLAAVKSKPLPKYAEGGVIVGRSHSAGGVKVLGGTSEVEGGEFITNKVTTSKNVDLLEYINAKKKRLDISDLLDFYNNGNARKTISNASPMRKYANGGQLPILRTDIDINDRLVESFEEYANKPTYVSVVDIQNATDRVNRVKVLSGLNV